MGRWRVCDRSRHAGVDAAVAARRAGGQSLPGSGAHARRGDLVRQHGGPDAQRWIGSTARLRARRAEAGGLQLRVRWRWLLDRHRAGAGTLPVCRRARDARRQRRHQSDGTDRRSADHACRPGPTPVAVQQPGPAPLRSRLPRITMFGAAQGLSNSEFSNGSTAITADGTVLAASSGGVMAFQPGQLARLERPGPPPLLSITRISVRRNGKIVTLPLDQPVRLGWRDSDLRVEARIASYVDPATNSYYYH